MTHIINSALLGLIEQAATAVATLVEGLEQNELLRSRLTRAEVLRQLKTLADSVGQIEPAARAEMPELDWDGWDAMRALWRPRRRVTGPGAVVCLRIAGTRHAAVAARLPTEPAGAVSHGGVMPHAMPELAAPRFGAFGAPYVQPVEVRPLPHPPARAVCRLSGRPRCAASIPVTCCATTWPRPRLKTRSAAQVRNCSACWPCWPGRLTSRKAQNTMPRRSWRGGNWKLGVRLRGARTVLHIT